MTRTCPSCGSGRVRRDGGCPSCLSCGWSRCTPVRADGGVVQDEKPLWKRDEDRFAEYRANYLHRQADIEEKKARALAYSELGYSDGGVASMVDVTVGTVTGWLDVLAVRFGPDAVRAKLPEEIAVDAELSPVTREELLDEPSEIADQWRELAETHAMDAPEWFAGGGGE